MAKGALPGRHSRLADLGGLEVGYPPAITPALISIDLSIINKDGSSPADVVSELAPAQRAPAPFANNEGMARCFLFHRICFGATAVAAPPQLASTAAGLH